jgi:hypothetical protein
MTKHLASRYLPGKRSSCWLKIKPVRRMPCAIIGWEPGTYGLRGLLVAAVLVGDAGPRASGPSSFLQTGPRQPGRLRRHQLAVSETAAKICCTLPKSVGLTKR